MSYTTHYKVSIVGALISSIAFTALAVFAIAPGETLDPVVDTACSGPNDPVCIINPYAYLDSESVLYLDSSGAITTDQSFTRTGDSFRVSASLPDNLETAFLMQEEVDSAIGNYPGIGMVYAQDDYNAFIGIVDTTGNPQLSSPGVISLSSQNTSSVSSFVLGPEGTITISTDNSYDYGSRMHTNLDQLYFDFSYENTDDPMDIFEDTRRITLDEDGITFSFLNGANSYTFPDTDGTNGQVLQTDGTGQISWATVSGGSSPITVINTNSLVSTEIASGGTVPSVSHSNFLGQSAGYNTSASYANFLGNAAGFAANGAHNSNFFGSSAGFSASNAFESNFFGNTAGESAINSYRSHFVGTDAGRYHSGNLEGSFNAANSIFIGYKANYTGGGYGLDNTTTNTTPDDGTSCLVYDCYSILLGNYTSTDGYSNSIAIGGYATNTAENQFMIGSTERPINEIVVVQTGGTECIIDTNGLGCTSDENLKTNITSLASTLEILSNIDAVAYNWNHDPNGSKQIGFIAQNLEQYFPELVSTNSRGQKSVYYAQMTPILTKAIQELNLKVSLLESQTIASGGFSLASLTTSAKDFLADVGNGIQNIFAKKITTEELCVGNTCISESELIELLESRETPLEEQDYIIIPELNQSEDQEILPIEDNEDEQEIVLEPEENLTSEISQEIIVE